MIDYHRQRCQNRGKSAGGLNCPTDLQFPRKYPFGNDRAGQYDGDETVTVLEQVQIQLGADQFVEIVEGFIEILADLP